MNYDTLEGLGRKDDLSKSLDTDWCFYIDNVNVVSEAS